MSALTRELEDQALELSASDRAYLAERLLGSLDAPNQSALDEQWAKESEARIKAYDQGLLEASEASVVFERIGAKYNK